HQFGTPKNSIPANVSAPRAGQQDSEWVRVEPDRFVAKATRDDERGSRTGHRVEDPKGSTLVTELVPGDRCCHTCRERVDRPRNLWSFRCRVAHGMSLARNKRG